MKIEGGYILQPRKIDESEVSKMPPVTRELWYYLLRKVSHKDNGNLKRGQGFFRFSDIQKDLSWSVGYRVEKYSKPQLTKSLRRLNEGLMTETAKTTRGIIITICNYEYYQTPENYEGNNEGNTKETRRKRGGHTINKNDKNIKKPLSYDNGKESTQIGLEISKFYIDQVESAKSILEKHPEAKTEVEAYKQFVLFLYDWKHKDKTDPSGHILHSPLSNILKLEKQLRFDQFVNHYRRANELGVDIKEKLMAIDNKKGYTDKLTDLNKTLHTWIKPYSK